MENKKLEQIRKNLNIETVNAYLNAKGNHELLKTLEDDIESIITECLLLQIDIRTERRLHQ